MEANSAPTVCAIVVTYNREELLSRCLDHLRAQTRAPDAIMVVDNASTDGTPDLLARQDDIEVLRLPVNGGGAGGFSSGLQRAYAAGYEWMWLLDDDTFAGETALEHLIEGLARAPERPSVMTSAVRWRDGSLHPMNRPWLRISPRGEFAEAADNGLVRIRAATFVSTMVRRDAVAEHGLPPGHYFVWLDDIAFTAKVLREGNGYLAPASEVVHWTPRAYDTVTDTRERFYFKVRNQLWLLRGSSFKGLERALYARAWLRAIVTYMRHSPSRRRALTTVARGVRDGLGPEPG